MNTDPEPTPAGKLSPPPARPTWVRWQIVVLLIGLSLLSYFNRIDMAAAYDERIHQELGISPEAMGYVYSALLLVYAICMTPGGWFIDRFGPRVALSAMCFGLALFGALTGLVGFGTSVLTPLAGRWGLGWTQATVALGLFLAVRATMGLFAAPMYPASAHIISRWLPFRRRAWANGLVQGAAPLGIACTYVAFGALIDWFDWRDAFLITAVVTGLWGLLWATYATDRPAQHTQANQAEQELIARAPSSLPDMPVLAELADGPAGSVVTGSWLDLLRNRSLVLLTVSYGAVDYFEYLFFYWMDYYFKEVLHLDPDLRRYYSGIPPLAMAVGMPLGGWLADRLVHAYGYRRGRVIMPVGGMVAAAVLLFAGLLTQNPAWIVTWFSLAVGAVGATEASFWTTALELGGRRGGTAAGICNTGGNVGGLLAPIVTPLVAYYLGWTVAIGLSSVICLTGACLWFRIDPCERVEKSATTPAG